MKTRRLRTHPSEGDPLWVQLYVRPVGPAWAAMIVPDGARPPKPGSLIGVAFLADSAEAAEGRAVTFLGEDLAARRGNVVVKHGEPNVL